MYQTFERRKTGLRPYISDKAAMRKGPNASPRRKIEKQTCVTELLKPRSSAIWFKAAAIILVDMRVAS
jgi:hypothetical protein